MNTTHMHTSRPSLQRLAAALRESGAALSLQHVAHLSSGTAALYGDVVGVVVFLSTPLISPGGKVGLGTGGRHFQVKDQRKEYERAK